MLKIEINEIAFVNESKEYLDVTVHAEGYITMCLETTARNYSQLFKKEQT